MTDIIPFKVGDIFKGKAKFTATEARFRIEKVWDNNKMGYTIRPVSIIRSSDTYEITHDQLIDEFYLFDESESSLPYLEQLESLCT